MASGSPERSGSAQPLLSLVVPIYNEAENIIPLLESLQESVKSDHETLLVYDFEQDTTIPPARSFQARYPQLRLLKNHLGTGAHNALKSGIAESRGDVVLVTMADLSDDVTQIDAMASLIREGADVVAGSRYVSGGRQVGGPPIKSFLSRAAGLTLRWLTAIGTHDATNNFKAYSRDLIDHVTIDSGSGFELGLELTTKAHLNGYDIREIATTWRDRSAGESNFKVLQWIPSYLRWYLTCLIGTWSGQRRRSANRRGKLASHVHHEDNAELKN